MSSIASGKTRGVRATCAIISGIVLLTGAVGANAQSSSTCMVMGGGLIHCDTMDMGSTDRFEDARVARFGLAIQAMRERSLRAKIGKMVAGGDCKGAYTYALTKGRMDLAGEVRNICG